MAAIGAVAGGMLAAGGSAYAASGQGRAGSELYTQQMNQLDWVRRTYGDQAYFQLLGLAQQQSATRGTVQNQIAANNLLGQLFGIGTPQAGAQPGGITPSTGFVAQPGGQINLAGTGYDQQAYGTTPANVLAPTDGRSVGGVSVAPGAPGTAAQGQITGNQLTMPGTGQIVTLPPGYDLSSLFAPYTASATPSLTQGNLPNLLSPATDVSAYLDPSLQWQTKMGEEAIKAGAAKSGTFGSGNMGAGMMELLQQLGQQGYGQAFQEKQADLSRIFNMLQGYATGSPAAVTAGTTATSAGTSGLASSAGGFGSNLANLYGQIGAGQAQTTLGQTNTWANLLQNLGGLATKYGSTYGQTQDMNTWTQNLQGLYGSGGYSVQSTTPFYGEQYTSNVLG